MEQLNLMTNWMLRQSGFYHKFSLFSFLLKTLNVFEIWQIFMFLLFLSFTYTAWPGNVISNLTFFHDFLFHFFKWRCASQNGLMDFVRLITNKLRFFWSNDLFYIFFWTLYSVFFLLFLNWLAITLPGSKRKQEQWSLYKLIINHDQNDSTDWRFLLIHGIFTNFFWSFVE